MASTPRGDSARQTDKAVGVVVGGSLDRTDRSGLSQLVAATKQLIERRAPAIVPPSPAPALTPGQPVPAKQGNA